jgi:hypothetical protein
MFPILVTLLVGGWIVYHLSIAPVASQYKDARSWWFDGEGVFHVKTDMDEVTFEPGRLTDIVVRTGLVRGGIQTIQVTGKGRDIRTCVNGPSAEELNRELRARYPTAAWRAHQSEV